MSARRTSCCAWSTSRPTSVSSSASSCPCRRPTSRTASAPTGAPTRSRAAGWWRRPTPRTWSGSATPSDPTRAGGLRSAAPDPDRPLGGRGVDDVPGLLDVDLAAVHEPPGGATGRLHQVAPRVLVADRASRVGRADRRRTRPLPEQVEDRLLQPAIHVGHAPLAARGRAVAHLVPVALPLLAPLDGAPARLAGLRLRGHAPQCAAHRQPGL